MKVVFRSGGEEIAEIDLDVVPKFGDMVLIETDLDKVEYTVVDHFWVIDLSTKEPDLPYICLTLAKPATDS